MKIYPPPTRQVYGNPVIGGTGNIAVTANRLYCFAFMVHEPLNLAWLCARVGSAGAAGLAEIGIYDSARNKIAEVTGLDTTTAYVTLGGAIDIDLAPGQYWLALVCNATPMLIGDNTATSFTLNDADTYGYAAGSYPLPATLPALSVSTGDIPIIMARA